MNQPSRRRFLAAASALVAGGVAVPQLMRAADAPAGAPPAPPAPGAAPARTFKTKLHKAMIVNKISEELLKPYKDAGFEGVELRGAQPEADAKAGREIMEKMGMRVHSIMRGWAEFNTKDPKKLEQTIDETAHCLRTAGWYGADAVLTVPCRVDAKAMKIPEPWEFKIEFDEKTGHATKVVEGDNAPYKDYIEAQNWAIDSSREAVKKLIPVAEEAKTIIALENVWNNLWCSPKIYRHFVASFNHPHVKSYFDIGNHVKYVAPEIWIRELGSLIVKCHVKDWRFQDGTDRKKGGFVHPRDGNINWPEVRKALDEVGYNGWLTIEDGGLPLKEFNRRIELIIAGE
jgi:hexulose-6-phosphate isomerase